MKKNIFLTEKRITLPTEFGIKTATFSKENEIIVLLENGDVFLYTIENQLFKKLFSVANQKNIVYTDGGFDLSDSVTIYTLDEAIVVANDYKTHAFLLQNTESEPVRIQREDYRADISCFPIGLYKNADNVPHLIYSTKWNRVNILNINTLQNLTASKSLIEEDAIEWHLEWEKKYPQHTSNTIWPSEFDYFYGKIHISPNNQYFLSAGWVWGSADAYYAFDTQDFIENQHVRCTNILTAEHENRAVCWIDNQTIAVGYNPMIDNDFGDEIENPQDIDELHLYKFDGKEASFLEKIPLSFKGILRSEMVYNQALNAIFMFSKNNRLLIFDLEGEILYENKNLNVISVDIPSSQVIDIEHNTIIIHKIHQQ